MLNMESYFDKSNGRKACVVERDRNMVDVRSAYIPSDYTYESYLTVPSPEHAKVLKEKIEKGEIRFV